MKKIYTCLSDDFGSYCMYIMNNSGVLKLHMYRKYILIVIKQEGAPHFNEQCTYGSAEDLRIVEHNKGGLAVLAFFISRKFTLAVVFILIRLPF